MKLIRGIHNVRAYHHSCVLTIGNFDSVHRGHQILLKNLKEQAQRLRLPTIVMIFEPQPLEFFLGVNAPARLTLLRDKIKYFVEYGVDYLLCVKFNLTFSCLSAKSFISLLLVEKLGVKVLLIGDDFQFGRNRKGDFRYLREAGKECGFEVVSTGSFCDSSGERVSSTAIRKALLTDNFTLATDLMGHSYRLSGRVIHGRKIGTKIGFPTANIPFKCLVMPPVKGVYAVKAYGLFEYPLQAVANIGTRPTINGIEQQIEVHLMGVCMDIYGSHIDIVFYKKLRNEKRFSSIEELRKQITKDIIAAKQFFLLS